MKKPELFSSVVTVHNVCVFDGSWHAQCSLVPVCDLVFVCVFHFQAKEECK